MIQPLLEQLQPSALKIKFFLSNFFSFGSKYFGLTILSYKIIPFLRDSYSSLLKHPIHSQSVPHINPFWKHSQYILRHIDLLQLHFLIFYFNSLPSFFLEAFFMFFEFLVIDLSIYLDISLTKGIFLQISNRSFRGTFKLKHFCKFFQNSFL